MIELHLADAAGGGERRRRGSTASASLRDVFRLPDLWQLHLYSVLGRPDRRRYDVLRRAGIRVSLTPAGTQVQFDYRGRSEHLYAHFRPRRRRASRRTSPSCRTRATPRRCCPACCARRSEASPSGSARMTAEVWTALWRIVELAAATTEGDVAGTRRSRPRSPTSRRTWPSRSRSPRWRALAGVSHNHLTRLFQAETGLTVIAYIRQPPDDPRPPPARLVDPVDPGGRRLGRHPRPAGLQQGLPPRARRTRPASIRNAVAGPVAAGLALPVMYELIPVAAGAAVRRRSRAAVRGGVAGVHLPRRRGEEVPRAAGGVLPGGLGVLPGLRRRAADRRRAGVCRSPGTGRSTTCPVGSPIRWRGR